MDNWLYHKLFYKDDNLSYEGNTYINFFYYLFRFIVRLRIMGLRGRTYLNLQYEICLIGIKKHWFILQSNKNCLPEPNFS